MVALILFAAMTALVVVLYAVFCLFMLGLASRADTAHREAWAALARELGLEVTPSQRMKGRRRGREVQIWRETRKTSRRAGPP